MEVVVLSEVSRWDDESIDPIPGRLNSIGLIAVVGEAGDRQRRGAGPQSTAFG